jgi:D-alanyl-D-alanine dipeptidase
MIRKHILRAMVTAAVLSVVGSAIGFAQGAAPAGAAAQSAQQTFRITPVRRIAELRAEALKATPPEEKGPFGTPILVELTKVDPEIHLEIRYATSDNFLGEPVYEQARAFLVSGAASALKRVSRKLQTMGYGLLVYDAYRPWYVTKIFWEAVPVDKREFVADPAQGSRHNRGCAVDATLYDLKTGAAVAMPSGYDEMTPRAYADYAGGTAEENEHRATLRYAMGSEGFEQRPNEWWHYDYKPWQTYPILNFPLDHVPEITPPKVLKRVQPEFSIEARKHKIDGTVHLMVTIDVNGKPGDIRVVQGLGYGLEEKAVEALKQWRFEPGMENGQPAPVTVKVEVNFRLY